MYPKLIEQAPESITLSIVSSLPNRAIAPCCQWIGLIPLEAPRNKSTRNKIASLHNSKRSLKMFQNTSVSPLEDNATSTKFNVITPKF